MPYNYYNTVTGFCEGVKQYLISEKSLIDKKIRQINILLYHLENCYKKPNGQGVYQINKYYVDVIKQFGETYEKRNVNYQGMCTAENFFKEDGTLKKYFGRTMQILDKKLTEINILYININSNLASFQSQLGDSLTNENLSELVRSRHSEAIYNIYTNVSKNLKVLIAKLQGTDGSSEAKLVGDLDPTDCSGGDVSRGNPIRWYKTWLGLITLEGVELVNDYQQKNHEYFSDIDNVLDIKDDILKDAKLLSMGRNVGMIKSSLLGLRSKTLGETCNKAIAALNKLRDQFTPKAPADYVVYGIYKQCGQQFHMVIETANWVNRAATNVYNEANVYYNVLLQGVNGLLNYIANNNTANAYTDLCKLFNSKGINDKDHLEQMAARLSQIWNKPRTIKRFKIGNMR